ncbi:NAD(P)H-binding protein [Nonomuraea dietziae]|uniref:Putative NADH-flavin reductase n=1 Tax=Nonomuraea dietziae TaxID=65515 RepID=A0A7W5V643_9ACTN|nr:NAD(P)H-binding protein [Nonomuraea dietziae]MBB3726214.1 putative NADH-flavin reductase [Nonomuraea dietziae]
MTVHTPRESKLTIFGATHMADVALMEEFLRGSDLDWTLMRIPYVVDRPLTGRYRTAYGRNLRGALRISRADAAHLMLALVGRPEAVRQTVTVAY